MENSPVTFELNPTSGVPIYRQIVEQVVAMIIGGVLRQGVGLVAMGLVHYRRMTRQNA